VVSRDLGLVKGWSDAFGGRVKFEGVVVGKQRHPLCFSF